MSNLKYKSKREFWNEHLKSFCKIFAGLFILFAWIFESTAFGSFFWAALLAMFIGGFSVYLTMENLLPDPEVMKRIFGGDWVQWK